MQPAPATPAATPKKSNKLLRGLLYTAFALATAGHFYSDYRQGQIRDAQDALIQAQDALIEAQGARINEQQLEIDVLKEEGGAGGVCDDGFIIQDLKPHGPIQVKVSKSARAVASKTI